MLKKFGWIFIGVICAIGIVGLIFKPGQNNKTSEVSAQYDLVEVGRTDLSEKVDATGSVVTSQNTDILAAYSGTVRRINVNVGALVRQGDLLMVLDSSELATEWAQANSSLRQAQLNLNLAEAELNRTKTLFAAEGATRDQLDNAQNKVDLAVDQVNLAKFKLDQIQTKPDNANFVGADHQSLTIRAPFSGKVAWLNVKQGEQVKTQTSLISIITSNSLMVEAQVDETEIKQVHPGQSVIITGNDTEQTEWKGKVFEVGSVGKEEQGVVCFPVRVKIKDKNLGLKPGMSVDITITISSHPNVLAVPSNIVTQRRGRSMVPTLQNGEIVYIRITPGFNNGTYTEVLEGLNEGDSVAVKKAVTTTPSKNQNNNRNGGFMPFGGRR